MFKSGPILLTLRLSTGRLISAALADPSTTENIYCLRSTSSVSRSCSRTLCSRAAAGGKHERTFIAVKPDGVQRGLIGDVVKRFERKGFKLVGMKMIQASDELLHQHYEHLTSKPFFPRVVKYMSSGPVVAMVWQGLNVVKTGRVMLGETNPMDSNPGTIRGDFSIQTGRNIVHGSDSVETAEREISLWFSASELFHVKPCDEVWVYED